MSTCFSYIFENLKISRILMKFHWVVAEQSGLYIQQKAKLAKYYSPDCLSYGVILPA